MESSKNLVFTITHGRTGTTFLTEVFKIFDDTVSLHEPEPNYASVLPRVKQDPRHAVEFLRGKLAYIESLPERNYVETSNVFGKGFFIPLLRLGIRPKLILLNRDFRKTATSLYERGSIPMKTRMGKHFSADPSVPGGLPVHAPHSLSDYQLCYWGVLDAYFRQLQAVRLYEEGGAGARYCWATAKDFHDFQRTLEMGRCLGLAVADTERARRQHQEIAGVHHNPNNKSRDSAAIGDFAREEVEVFDRAGFHDPGFVESALDSGFVAADVGQAFNAAA